MNSNTRNICSRCGSTSALPESNLCPHCYRLEAEAASLSEKILSHGRTEAAFLKWWNACQAYAAKKGCPWTLSPNKEDHRKSFLNGIPPEVEIESKLEESLQ